MKILLHLLLLLAPECCVGFANLAAHRSCSSTRLLYREDHAAPTVAPTAAPRAARSVFAPWPQSVLTVHGDYLNETHLESRIGGLLYEKQAELPRLPVPPLEDTIHRLLPTVLPLARRCADCTNSCCEHKAGTSEFCVWEHRELFQAADEFSEQARVLQDRLVGRHRDEYADSSWLQGLWQTTCYLQYRAPLPVHVSYYLLVPDDGKLPKDSSRGLKRGAAILWAVAESRKQICSGMMPTETIGDTPLCSTAFKYLFHSTRIPQRHQDVYRIYDPSLYKHCVVATGGQFFAVDIVGENDDPLPLTVLESRLQICQELATDASKKEYPELGWLTSCDRDSWADARRVLTETGGDKMKNALERLESGAFVLNLDAVEPETLTDAATEFWHGGDVSGGNRWFDKSMQIICTKNGRVAYQGEHSMLDAAPVIPVIRRIIKHPYSKLQKKVNNHEETTMSRKDIRAGVCNIFEECWSDPELLEAASILSMSAKKHHAEMTHEYELGTVSFTKYGKKFVKQAGFFGPEYAQMAIQLAGYRLFGKSVSTYEAALTRTFLHGRTETSRAVSPETFEFVKAMANNAATKEEKFDALKHAASVFSEYVSLASKGLGVDRHLFGLSNMRKDGEELPSLFSNSLFLSSKKFRLSTSSVIFCPGFGPTEDDGIGVGFNVEKDAFMYTCTSRTENGYVDRFCQLLEEALEEIGELLPQ